MAREKRRTARGQVSATVVLLHEQRSLGSHRVLNLSRGGALLVGKAPVSRPAGMEALVRLSPGRVVRAGATIVREESVDESTVFAIEFSSMSADDRTAIESVVLTAVEDERDPTALIVTGVPDLQLRLRDTLADLGHRAFSVGALADLQRLLDAPNSLTVVLVDLGLEPALLDEVVELLTEQHPSIRRILLDREPRSPAALAILREGQGTADTISASSLSKETLARVLKAPPASRD